MKPTIIVIPMPFQLVFPADAGFPLNKGVPSESSNVIDAPSTASELTTAVQRLCDEYKIDKFEIEFSDAARACGASNESLTDGTFTPLQLIEMAGQGQYEQFVKCIEQLDKKYNFQNFHADCSSLRISFEHQRNGYLFNNLMTQCSIMMFMSPLQSEILFMEWLDGIVAARSPKMLWVDYEDLSGVFQKIRIVEKPDEITEDYVDCRPLNYYSGRTPYDSFVMRFYYCPDQEKWVAIPVNLIRRFTVCNDEPNATTL